MKKKAKSNGKGQVQDSRRWANGLEQTEYQRPERCPNDSEMLLVTCGRLCIEHEAASMTVRIGQQSITHAHVGIAKTVYLITPFDL